MRDAAMDILDFPLAVESEIIRYPDTFKSPGSAKIRELIDSYIGPRDQGTSTIVPTHPVDGG